MKTKYVLLSGLVAVLCAGASAVSAHEGKASTEVRGEVKTGLHLGHFGHWYKGNSNDKDRIEWRAIWEEKLSHFKVGVVTSLNGMVFTIDPIGSKSTTTVTTNASTVFKAKGAATTSAALSVGSKVFLMGTTTATSTSGDSFSASLVALIGKGFGHLRAWFFLH